MKRLLVLLLVLIPVLLLVFANAVYSAPPSEPGALLSFLPVVTFIPHPTFLPLDMVADIPDPALRAALHTKTGVPASEDIYASDLAALTGSLFLDNCGIANAEGLQYCKNIQTLSLEGNSLTTMPIMSGMTSLNWLKLGNNNLNIVPTGILSIPNLERLEIYDNPITDIDISIADMTDLKELDLRDTDLTSFPIALLPMDNLEILRLDNVPVKAIPDDISNMTDLEELSLQNTGLESLPSSISELTNLNYLNISHNKLESLPDSICALHISELNVSNNNLYCLPEHIGDHVATLLVHCNRLTAIPQSVISSPAINTLNIMANRLTSLPSGFAGKTFDGINVEFNFIDVSPGSAAREMLDDNESSMKYYSRQLKPLEVTEEAGPNWVQLSWAGSENGSEDGATWEVTGYVVYQYKEGEMVKLDECGTAVQGFAHVGLTPETDYSYRVGVDYRIIDPALMIDYTNRGYTAVDITTLPAGAQTPLPSVFTTAAASSEASPGSLPAAEQTSAAAPEGNAFPVWAIIIAAAGALGIVGTGVAIVILKARKPKA